MNAQSLRVEFYNIIYCYLLFDLTFSNQFYKKKKKGKSDMLLSPSEFFTAHSK